MSSNKSNIAILRCIIIFFKLLGLVPFRVNIISKKATITATYKLRNSIYNLLLLLCLMTTFYYQTINNPEVKFQVRSINDFAEKVYMIMENITAMMILLSYAKNQRTATDIFKHLVELTSDLSDSNLVKKRFVPENTYFYLKSPITMIFMIIIHILLAIFLFILETLRNTHGPLFNITRPIPLFIISSFIIQYSLIVIHLKDLFSAINSSLVAIKNQSISNQIIPDRTLTCLKKLRTSYRRLRDISQTVSRFNSWPILFVFIHFCPALTYSCWKLYYNFTDSTPTQNFTTKNIKCLMTAVWIVKNLYPTSTLIISITKLFGQINKIDKIVCEIGRTCSNVRIRDETEQFSMELLHKNINFNAFGFFSLQGSLLISLLHTALSYTFIIINYSNHDENNSTK